MFAHDLCDSQIEYFRNATRREPLGRTIDLDRKDRATRGAHAAQALAPPACKPTGSLRAGSAARAIPNPGKPELTIDD